MKELENKVKKYLTEEGLKFLAGSISYSGLRKGKTMFNGEKKDVHIVSFQLVVGKDLEDQICFIYIDAKTDKLEYLITPHIFERIDFL